MDNWFLNFHFTSFNNYLNKLWISNIIIVSIDISMSEEFRSVNRTKLNYTFGNFVFYKVTTQYSPCKSSSYFEVFPYLRSTDFWLLRIFLGQFLSPHSYCVHSNRPFSSSPLQSKCRYSGNFCAYKLLAKKQLWFVSSCVWTICVNCNFEYFFALFLKKCRINDDCNTNILNRNNKLSFSQPTNKNPLTYIRMCCYDILIDDSKKMKHKNCNSNNRTYSESQYILI